MVRFEEKKLVIEITTKWPADKWKEIMSDLIYAIGALDKERVDNNNDCTYGMCELLTELLPDELVLRKMLEEKGVKP